MAERAGKKCVINMRVRRDVLALIDAAAEAKGVTRTRLLLDSSKARAEQVIREARERAIDNAGKRVVRFPKRKTPPGPPEPARPSTPREVG
jgi:uncharacterized protein (DUF1778 family)